MGKMGVIMLIETKNMLNLGLVVYSCNPSAGDGEMGFVDGLILPHW